jgi:hypothetical protein
MASSKESMSLSLTLIRSIWLKDHKRQPWENMVELPASFLVPFRLLPLSISLRLLLSRLSTIQGACPSWSLIHTAIINLHCTPFKFLSCSRAIFHIYNDKRLDSRVAYYTNYLLRGSAVVNPKVLALLWLARASWDKNSAESGVSIGIKSLCRAMPCLLRVAGR